MRRCTEDCERRVIGRIVRTCTGKKKESNRGEFKFVVAKSTRGVAKSTVSS